MYGQPNYYGNQYFAQPMQYRPQPMQQPMQQPQMEQPIFNKQLNLQGKSVDNIDVVKAMDIPLDGSISYFPIADGSAIVTKQLNQDGTSKTIIYKPVTENETKKEEIKYVTPEELKKELKKYDTDSLKEDIKSMKKQIKILIQKD